MRRIKAAPALATFCVALAASFVVEPAVAAPRTTGGPSKPDGCVTQREFDKVEVGMPRKAVHKGFGTTGHRESVTHSGARTDEVRSYKACNSPDSTVTVSFEKGRRGPFKVKSKTAVWVD